MNPPALRQSKEVLNVDMVQPGWCISQVSDGGKEQVKIRNCFLIFLIVCVCPHIVFFVMMIYKRCLT